MPVDRPIAHTVGAPAFSGTVLVFALLLAIAGGAAENRGPGPASVAQPTPELNELAAELGLGRWIWTTNFADKQTCRLWRAFAIPGSNAVHEASLRITADNSYRLFMDGREIGQGGNWNGLTD